MACQARAVSSGRPGSHTPHAMPSSAGSTCRRQVSLAGPSCVAPPTSQSCTYEPMFSIDISHGCQTQSNLATCSPGHMHREGFRLVQTSDWPAASIAVPQRPGTTFSLVISIRVHAACQAPAGTMSMVDCRAGEVFVQSSSMGGRAAFCCDPCSTWLCCLRDCQRPGRCSRGAAAAATPGAAR